jgi:hypothetical protein
MTESKSVGFLLGAGASYELGMPLVWNLTGEFKGYFTPEHVRKLNAGWRTQGGGYDDFVIEATIALLREEELHYENILGYLQTVFRRPQQSLAEQYHGMYECMIEAVYLLLYHRQAKSLPFIRRGFTPYEGLASFARRPNPVWIFSLNHDLMIELLAQNFGIPLRDGFWPDKVLTIPRKSNVAPAPLQANILSEADLNNSNLHLFKPSESGINLLKLHGALDVFAFRDGLDLCRLCPVGQELNDRLDALRIINEEIGYLHGGKKVRVINEIAYTDEVGEMQFLRRTLLAGAQKFNKRFSQTLPQSMLDIFRSHINFVSELYIIGYSFGDAHIDLVVRDWLEFSGDRTMVIVDPSRQRCPPQFAHLLPQIQIKSQTAAQFFASYRDKPMTMGDKLEQKIRATLRPFFEKRAAKKR